MSDPQTKIAPPVSLLPHGEDEVEVNAESIEGLEGIEDDPAEGQEEPVVSIPDTFDEQVQRITDVLPPESRHYAIEHLRACHAQKGMEKENNFNVAYDAMVQNEWSFVQLPLAYRNKLTPEQTKKLGNLTSFIGRKYVNSNELVLNSLMRMSYQDPEKFCGLNIREETAGIVSVNDTKMLLALQEGYAKGDGDLAARASNLKRGEIAMRRALQEYGIDPAPLAGTDIERDVAGTKNRIMVALEEERKRKGQHLTDEEVEGVAVRELSPVFDAYGVKVSDSRQKMIDEITPRERVSIEDFLRAQGKEVTRENIAELWVTRKNQYQKDANDVYDLIPNEDRESLQKAIQLYNTRQSDGENARIESTPHVMTLLYSNDLNRYGGTIPNQEELDAFNNAPVDFTVPPDSGQYARDKIISEKIGIPLWNLAHRRSVDPKEDKTGYFLKLLVDNPQLVEALTDPRTLGQPLSEASKYIHTPALSVDDVDRLYEKFYPAESEKIFNEFGRLLLRLKAGNNAGNIQEIATRIVWYDKINQMSKYQIDVQNDKGWYPGIAASPFDPVHQYAYGTPEERKKIYDDDKAELQETIKSFAKDKAALGKMYTSPSLKEYRRLAESNDLADQEKAKQIYQRYGSEIIQHTIYEQLPEFLIGEGLSSVPGVGPIAALAFSANLEYCKAVLDEMDKQGIDPSTPEGIAAMQNHEIMDPIFRKAMGVGMWSFASGAVGDKISSEIVKPLKVSKPVKFLTEKAVSSAVGDTIDAGVGLIMPEEPEKVH